MSSRGLNKPASVAVSGQVRSCQELATALASGPFDAVEMFDPPRGGGLYAIKLARDAWAGTRLDGDGRATAEAIAYVGKAEGRERGVAERWRREHLAAHSGRSSPRRSWLAILAPAWNLPIYARPCAPGKKPNANCYVSDRDGERRLRRWIDCHYRVSAVALTEPELARVKTLETCVICILRPYASAGTPHPLWAELFEPGRRELIAEARRRVSAGDVLGLAHHRG